MQGIYLTSNGVLKRKDNILYFMNRDEELALPVDNIDDIYCYGKVSLRSGACSLLLKKGVPIHYFNKYGYYEGSLYPRIKFNSGSVAVNQAEHYLNNEMRCKIAGEMIRGTKHNILQVLRYYQKKGRDVDSFMENIANEYVEGDILTLRSIEGRIWNSYYQSFNKISDSDTFRMNKREIRPPTSEMNSLISFGNSLLYSTTLSEIYNTYLHPSISFLHEPAERRFSLALDITDIFKPVIVERVIFKLINNRMLEKKDFDRNAGVFLNQKGKKTFLHEYQNKLDTTLLHPKLKRRVSYRHLIRLECYKLVKHITGGKPYKSFRMWW